MASVAPVPGCGHLDGVVAEVGQLELAQQQAAVGVRVGAHAPLARGRQRGQLRAQRAVLVEQLLGAVGAQPLLQLGQVLGLGAQVGKRHLMGAEGSLRRQAVDHLGAGPALGRAQHDHRPARPLGRADVVRAGSRAHLDLGDLGGDLIEGGGHQLVHRVGVRALDEMWGVAVALEQRAQLLRGDAGEDGGAGDLVAVEMQHRQDGPVVHGIEELVGVPAGGQRARFGLAVADHAADEQVRVVEGGAVGVHEGVAQLAALVDRAGRLGGDVAGDAAGEGELAEEPAQPLLVVADVWDRPRCRCPPGRCWPPARGRRGRGRSRRSR